MFCGFSLFSIILRGNTGRIADAALSQTLCSQRVGWGEGVATYCYCVKVSKNEITTNSKQYIYVYVYMLYLYLYSPISRFHGLF